MIGSLLKENYHIWSSSMKEQIVFLFDYNAWASALMWQAIHPLSAEQWLQPQPYSIGSVHDQVTHIMDASTRWLHTLQGDTLPGYEPALFADWREAERQWHTQWKEIDQYIHDLSEEGLYESVSWGPTRRGMRGLTPRWQVLTHVANHATDHRSQVLMNLNTQFGIPTPEQDVIFYIHALANPL
jgi:uncharacterized damage-inducible protein DinB